MDPGKFGGGSAPLRFDMAGGGGQLSFSMDAAPVMPGMDFSGGATDKVSFSMDAGAATAAAEAPAQAATTKARGLTGRVVLSLAGIAGGEIAPLRSNLQRAIRNIPYPNCRHLASGRARALQQR